MSKKNKKKCPEFCCNCKHWEIMYSEKEWEEKGELACGCCRRYPPYVPSVFVGDICITNQYGGSSQKVKDVVQFEDPTKGGLCVGHPVTFSFESCGEFKKMKKLRYKWKEWLKDGKSNL